VSGVPFSSTGDLGQPPLAMASLPIWGPQTFGGPVLSHSPHALVDGPGLGVLNLDIMNICLLCKWLWKLENEDGAWQSILRKKYL
jgi:hypothetical protein